MKAVGKGKLERPLSVHLREARVTLEANTTQVTREEQCAAMERYPQTLKPIAIATSLHIHRQSFALSGAGLTNAGRWKAPR